MRGNFRDNGYVSENKGKVGERVTRSKKRGIGVINVDDGDGKSDTI